MFHDGQEYGDLPMQVSALNKLGFVTALMQGQFPEAEEHLVDAERLADQCGDLAGLAELHMTYCFLRVPFGLFDDAVDHLGQVAKIGQDLTLEEPRLFGLTHIANTLTYMTRFEEARHAAQEALQAAESLGNRMWQSELLGLSIPINHLRNGDLEAARQSAQMAANMAAEIGAALQEGYAQISLGQVLWLRGEYEGAYRALSASRGGRPHFRVCLLFRCQRCADWARSIWTSAAGYPTRPPSFTPRPRNSWSCPLAMHPGAWHGRTWVFCVLATGNVDRQTISFRKVLPPPRLSSFWPGRCFWSDRPSWRWLGTTLPRPRSWSKKLREFADDRAMRHFYPLISLAQAQVSLGLGDKIRALEEFDRAEALALEMGMRPLAWQARAGGAQVLATLGREGKAADKRRGALDLIHEIGGLFEDQGLRSMYLEDAVKKLE